MIRFYSPTTKIKNLSSYVLDCIRYIISSIGYLVFTNRKITNVQMRIAQLIKHVSGHYQ